MIRQICYSNFGKYFFKSVGRRIEMDLPVRRQYLTNSFDIWNNGLKGTKRILKCTEVQKSKDKFMFYIFTWHKSWVEGSEKNNN
jgi:hypothetical protein